MGINGTKESEKWEHYQKLVLTELSRLNDQHNGLQNQQRDIVIEIAALKVKSSFWGFVGGMIAAALPIVLTLLK